MKDSDYTVSGLREAIDRLERQRIEEAKQLRTSLTIATESLKPVNLLRNTVKEFVGTEEMRDLLIRIGAAVIAGLITKLLFDNEEDTTQAKKLVQSAIQVGITTTLSNHPEAIQQLGNRITELLHRDAA